MAYDEYDKEHDENIGSLFYEKMGELSEDAALSIMNAFKNGHRKMMYKHAGQYTNLLKRYIQNSKTTAKQKKWFKNIFFTVAMLILIVSFALFVVLSISFAMKEWDDVDVTALTGLISSLAGILSLYIIIPKIIADYLFNTKEDDNMTKIVESIQKYDESVFNSMNSYSFKEATEIEGIKDVISSLKKQAEDNIQEKQVGNNIQEEKIDVDTKTDDNQKTTQKSK